MLILNAPLGGDKKIDPLIVEEAMAGPNRSMWIKGIENEMISIKEKETRESAFLVEGMKAIKSRWLFLKLNSIEKSERFNTQIVSNGYSWIKCSEYEKLFSPVAKCTRLRLLLAMSARRNLNVV